MNEPRYLDGTGTLTTYDYGFCPVCNRKLTSRNVVRYRNPPICRKCANKIPKHADIDYITRSETRRKLWAGE